MSSRRNTDCVTKIKALEKDDFAGWYRYTLVEYVAFLKLGVPFWGPSDKEYSVLRSILGSPWLVVVLTFISPIFQ